MLDPVLAAMPQHGRAPARARWRLRARSARQDRSPGADRRGRWGDRAVYRLWYGPVTAINLLLLSAEAALLNQLLTVVFRGRLAGALDRAAVRLLLIGGFPKA